MLDAGADAQVAEVLAGHADRRASADGAVHHLHSAHDRVPKSVNTG